MTDDEIKRARELCERLVPGPWTVVSAASRDAQVLDDFVVDDANECWVAECGNDQPAAKFIASARTLVPQLLDEVERLRAENTKQAMDLLDPDATCCADASRRHKELRLDYEAKLAATERETAERIATWLARCDETDSWRRRLASQVRGGAWKGRP